MVTTRSVSGPTHDDARARPRTHHSKLQSVAAAITQRDQRICADLYEHRVLTTFQLFELHFPSYVRARRRLLELHRLGVIWRTRPRKRPGSLPWHYLLDELGVLVVAESRGVDANELRFRFERALGMVDSPKLGHLRETNGFFTRLAYTCRSDQGGYRLGLWLGERTCAKRWDGLVRPDGLGRLEGPEASVSFALELDRGTESRDRLEGKLERYLLISSVPDSPEVVLFCFPSHEREQSARQVLHRAGLPVATSTMERHLGDPLGQVWRPLGSDRRARLTDLGSAGRTG
jgi:hypothetical protein